MREPVKLHPTQIGIGQLLQQFLRAGPLDGDLGKVVAQVFGGAVEAADVLVYPVEILLSGAGVDNQQELPLAQTVHDDIVHERALGIEQGGVLGLPDGETRGVVHGDVLGGFHGLRAGDADIAMWLTSKMPARVRTARCSAMSPPVAGYSTGISQPLNSTILAPMPRCTAFRAVLRMAGVISRLEDKGEIPRWADWEQVELVTVTRV